MKRRRKSGEPSPYAGMPGLGLEDVTITDCASWLPLDELPPGDQRWLRALEKAEGGDMNPILALLKEQVSPFVFEHLEDFFARHPLGKRRGRPATPSYDRSAAELFCENACREVQRGIKSGQKPDTAIDDVAKRWEIDHNALENAWRGKRGSSRRKAPPTNVRAKG